MEGALPTIAYNRGGGGGIGAVIFDKPSIDPLEALNLTIQREQQAEQQKAANQERQLNRTYQMLKDIDFDVSGVYDYDLPMFRERTEALNKKAGQVLQKYANKPELQGEFLNEWQRDIRGEYNDLKLLMEESKSDKETVAKALQLYAANPQKYDEGVDAAVAQINLLPVGGRTKDGLSRKQLAMGALKPSFNEQKFISDAVADIEYDELAKTKSGVDGSVQVYKSKEIPATRLYQNAQFLYGANNQFKEKVNSEFNALLNSNDPTEVALARHYISAADQIQKATGDSFSPTDIYIAEEKMAPMVGKKGDIRGLIGRKPQERAKSKAQSDAENMEQEGSIFLRKWNAFASGDANEIDNLVKEGGVLKNEDGSYSTTFIGGYSMIPDSFYEEDTEILKGKENSILELRRFPDGTLRMKTLASATRHDVAKYSDLEQKDPAKYKKELAENPEYRIVSPKVVQAIFNVNSQRLGGLAGYERALKNYEATKKPITPVEKEGRVTVGTVQKDAKGQDIYVPTQQQQPKQQSAPKQTGNMGKSKGESFIDWKKRTGKTSYLEWGKS